MLESELITKSIIGAAIAVHRHLGPGLLERIYVDALRYELSSSGLAAESEVLVPVTYRGYRLGAPLRMDLLVEKTVIVEIKSVESVLPVHESQLMSYLRLTGIKVGLLINFNVTKLTDGILRRVV
jgi:GxxExxY protein